MNEEPEFHIAEKDPSVIIERKFNDPIWGKLESLLVGGDEKLTPEKVEYLVLEVNMEINHVLEMIIVGMFEELFKNDIDKLAPFIKKLNWIGKKSEGEKDLQEGELVKRQIKMIDDLFGGETPFWEMVEKELVEKCLNPLVKDLKAAEAEDFVRNRELREKKQ